MAQPGRKRPVVLVVEDELLIRTDAVDMLRDAGFDVIEAVNAEEAIMILEGGSTIDVVFTAIQMPGSMDGLKLAAAVKNVGHQSRSGDLGSAQDRRGRFAGRQPLAA